MTGEVEKPRTEPEIIPPDRTRPREAAWTDAQGMHRVYVARVGPLGFGLLALGVGLFAAVMLLLFLGAFLVLIPAVGLLLAVAVITGLMRGHFGRRG